MCVQVKVSSVDPCVSVCLRESVLCQIRTEPPPLQKCNVQKDTTVAAQIAFSVSTSHSWPTVRGFVRPFDTGKIYSAAGMKILLAGLGIEKTDLLSCNKGLIPVG